MFNEAHKALNRWYQENGRHDLPWRQTKDPYPVYVSEIMLQQTQVKTVLERFYFPFLEAFPTLCDVAEADLDEVLKRWEGLGYYTRARNLHAAARQCGGILPDNASELMKLPGIGRSTAHAVAAFAYRESLPILDANVKRILHRYFAVAVRNEKRLWELAYTLFDPAHPFEYNQAMMDLGSSICTPKRPLCGECPLQHGCIGKEAPQSYPSPKPVVSKPIRKKFLIVHTRDGRYALSQRQSRFLSGLWGFYETTEPIPLSMEYLGNIIQHYSHFTLDADLYLNEESYGLEGFEWFDLAEIDSLSLSRADHKAVALIRYNLEKKKGSGC